MKKFKEKDQEFSPVNYLDDEEKYFELMKQWKNEFEKDYLDQYPHLRLDPVRHKNFYRHQKVISLRSIVIFF